MCEEGYYEGREGEYVGGFWHVAKVVIFFVWWVWSFSWVVWWGLCGWFGGILGVFLGYVWGVC